MTVTIGGERVTRLTEFRRRARGLIDQLKAAKNQQESRVVLTTHGEPVAVLQEYSAYQKLLELLEKQEHELHLAEVQRRLKREGEADGIPLEQVAAEFGIELSD